MVKSIFISKNSGELEELQRFADANDIRLKAKSFLNFQRVDFELPPSFDVIFFGSPRAVIFYQSQYSVPKEVQIASVGGKTSALLMSMGYEVAFNGEDQGSISEVAKHFQTWLGNRKVLFPVSTKSLGTISKGLPSHQALHAECYDTQIVEHTLEENYEAYVFTSPSNVEGFFAKNELPEASTAIAWGESTQKALINRKVQQIVTLPNPSVSDLIDMLHS